MSKSYVAAIDRGTRSSIRMVVDHGGTPVGSAQKDPRPIFPRPGWVELDALEIWDNEQEVVDLALAGLGVRSKDLAGLGIANQRETTVP